MNEIRTPIQHRWHRNITDVLMNHRNITADSIFRSVPAYVPLSRFFYVCIFFNGNFVCEYTWEQLVVGAPERALPHVIMLLFRLMAPCQPASSSLLPCDHRRP